MNYVAFVRSINVGKYNRIKMTDLRELCLAVGFEHVKTHLQTGNVLFSSSAQNPESLTVLLEQALEEHGLKNASVMVWTGLEMAELLELGVQGVFKYLTLFRNALPETAANLLLEKDLEAQILYPRAIVWNGEVGASGLNPHAFLERKLKIPATTRYWSVFQATFELLEGK